METDDSPTGVQSQQSEWGQNAQPLSRDGSIVRIADNDFIWFLNKKTKNTLQPEHCGKWMHFFASKNCDYVDQAVGGAVLCGAVAAAKYSGPLFLKSFGTQSGMCCFYLNDNDTQGHIRILSYMMEHGLIPKTKTGRFHNISFKYDSQTYAGENSSSGFVGKIKLADFVDLETGRFLKP